MGALVRENEPGAFSAVVLQELLAPVQRHLPFEGIEGASLLDEIASGAIIPHPHDEGHPIRSVEGGRLDPRASAAPRNRAVVSITRTGVRFDGADPGTKNRGRSGTDRPGVIDVGGIRTA
jgi:hypothetical protein